MATAKKTSLENKHLGNGDYFVIIASSSDALLTTFRLEYVVDRARCKWTGKSTVEVNIEDERFTVVVRSRCRQCPKSGNFPLSFGRLRQRIVLKPGFHIVVSVVSVVRKKFIAEIQLYGNLPYNCSIQ